MTFWKNLVVALVAAFVLAACSSSDNGTVSAPDPDPTTTVDLAAERTDINAKITAARTAVAGLTDDASDAAIGSAESAVAAAKTAVTASSVPDSEKAAFNTAISVIEGNLGTSKTSIAEARAGADEAMAKANAKTGKELHAALAGPTPETDDALDNIGAPTLAAADLTVNAAAGAGTLEDSDDPSDVILEAGDSAGALGSWNGTDYALSTGTGDAMVTNEARVYTNPGAAERVAFSTTSSGLTAADATAGTYTVATADAAQVAGSAFVHHGTQTHEFNAPGAAEFVTQGTYLGAPGEYRCTGQCSSTNDGSGSPSALAGTWTFKPDAGAMVSDPDDHYLYYGWWVSKDNDGVPTAASAFAGFVGTPTNGGDLTRADLTGSATYVGKAAGKFAMNNPLDGTGNGGHFTADAMLSATFSGTDTGVSGTIDNFRLNDGSEDPGWSVALARGELGSSVGMIMAPTEDPTVWSINGNDAPASGIWSGTMYDELPGATDATPPGDGSNIPTTVTGTFYSEFSSIGRMVGAFGADKQ